jgi:hypothetical protein
VKVDMSTDPDQIRAAVAARLADLPAVREDADELHETDIDAVAAHLEQAHDLLVEALQSVDRGPAAASGTAK